MLCALPSASCSGQPERDAAHVLIFLVDDWAGERAVRAGRSSAGADAHIDAIVSEGVELTLRVRFAAHRAAHSTAAAARECEHGERDAQRVEPQGFGGRLRWHPAQSAMGR